MSDAARIAARAELMRCSPLSQSAPAVKAEQKGKAQKGKTGASSRGGAQQQQDGRSVGGDEPAAGEVDETEVCALAAARGTPEEREIRATVRAAQRDFAWEAPGDVPPAVRDSVLSDWAAAQARDGQGAMAAQPPRGAALASEANECAASSGGGQAACPGPISPDKATSSGTPKTQEMQPPQPSSQPLSSLTPVRLVDRVLANAVSAPSSLASSAATMRITELEAVIATKDAEIAREKAEKAAMERQLAALLEKNRQLEAQAQSQAQSPGQQSAAAQAASTVQLDSNTGPQKGMGMATGYVNVAHFHACPFTPSVMRATGGVGGQETHRTGQRSGDPQRNRLEYTNVREDRES